MTNQNKSKFDKIVEKYKLNIEKEVNKNKFETIRNLVKVIDNINSLAWNVKNSARDINCMYSGKFNSLEEECKAQEVKIVYPLDLRPKKLIDLQGELDNVSNQLSNIATQYEEFLLSSS